MNEAPACCPLLLRLSPTTNAATRNRPYARRTPPPPQATLMTSSFGISGKPAQDLVLDLYEIASTNGASCATVM